MLTKAPAMTRAGTATLVGAAAEAVGAAGEVDAETMVGLTVVKLDKAEDRDERIDEAELPTEVLVPAGAAGTPLVSVPLGAAVGAGAPGASEPVLLATGAGAMAELAGTPGASGAVGAAGEDTTEVAGTIGSPGADETGLAEQSAVTVTVTE